MKEGNSGEMTMGRTSVELLALNPLSGDPMCLGLTLGSLLCSFLAGNCFVNVVLCVL